MINKVKLIRGGAVVIALGLVFPQFGVAELELSELKNQQEQTELRARLLKEGIAEEERNLAGLDAEAADLQANVTEIELQLYENEKRIAELNRALAEREAMLLRAKNNLAAAVRNLEEAERTSAAALFFGSDNFSEAIREIDQKQAATVSIARHYQDIAEHTESMAGIRDQLELTKMSLVSSRITLDLQSQALRAQQQYYRAMLDSSQSLLYVAEVQITDLRSQIFAIAFDNTTRIIDFEQAVGFAQLAAKRLREDRGQNISVPLLLAIVRHESNFGNFLGRADYRRAMCSQAQIDAFLYITGSLGLDPELTPVSQPAKNQSCGGAMGYAQFLPRTWLGYAGQVANLTGNHPPSPWNPEDAFMAVALKLSADGATRGSSPAEIRRSQWEAVMTYFSGSRWRNPAILPNISWYADNVLRTADSFAILLRQ